MLTRDLFVGDAARNDDPNVIGRATELYQREDDIRTEFGRDYTRILHSLAYRRLKHKTQVFFAPLDDHLCTRIEHVNHVESVSFTIAKFMGLNTELTKAISAGHDLGHAPFGHLGENILKKIAKDNGFTFWHERNGLHFVDDIELLEDDHRDFCNLNLTYAVRDGIISHCGEVDQNGLKPRSEHIDLSEYRTVNQFAPFTWEGCIVKIADKISYLGRDIEDALSLKLINTADTIDLIRLSKKHFGLKGEEVNTTVLMHKFILDLCRSSSPEKGLALSEPAFEFMREVKTFNYDRIYKHPRLQGYREYAEVIINRLYNVLLQTYKGLETVDELKKAKEQFPKIFEPFSIWISKYWDLTDRTETRHLKNRVIYRVADGEQQYKAAILDYIAGMTDRYAIRMFNEIVSF